ncbi:MAG: hypothetical protein AAGE65_02710 [Planctomycetota bacterium]
MQRYLGHVERTLSNGQTVRAAVRNPRSLTDARLQLHWAAQAIVAVTDALLPRRGDDGQSNLGPIERVPGVMCSHPLSDGRRVGLNAGRGSSPALVMLSGRPEANPPRLPIHGQTLGQLFDWLQKQLPELSGQALTLRDYDLPDHPVRRGHPFDSEDDPEAFEQMWEHLLTGHAQLEALRRREPFATEPRLWPHHFDTGLLIGLEPDADFANAPSIGVGYAAGDDTYDQPYYYVNAYGAERPDRLPALPLGGFWEDDGVRARLLQIDLPWDGSNNPDTHAQSFLNRTVHLCRDLLRPS